MTSRHLSALVVLSGGLSGSLWQGTLVIFFQLHLSHFSYEKKREPFFVSPCAEEEQFVGGCIFPSKPSVHYVACAVVW